MCRGSMKEFSGINIVERKRRKQERSEEGGEL